VQIGNEAINRDIARYIFDPFHDVDFGDFAATGHMGNWAKEWERGRDPAWETTDAGINRS
jgi:hypothetical protein